MESMEAAVHVDFSGKLIIRTRKDVAGHMAAMVLANKGRLLCQELDTD